jgi:hypothetical protein
VVEAALLGAMTRSCFAGRQCKCGQTRSLIDGHDQHGKLLLVYVEFSEFLHAHQCVLVATHAEVDQSLWEYEAFHL